MSAERLYHVIRWNVEKFIRARQEKSQRSFLRALYTFPGRERHTDVDSRDGRLRTLLR